MTRTQAFLDRNHITQSELGAAIGYEQAAISRKLSGSRNWRLFEIRKVLAYLSERLGRLVSFDEVFGADDVVDHADSHPVADC
jgi:predicted transcriptional regulator